MSRFKPLQSIQRQLLRLKRDESALALTEFAFAAPILLLLGMVGIETVNFIAHHQKASQLAVLIADSASRKLERVDEQDVAEIFFGAHVSGENYDLGSKGRVILTQLTDNGRVGSSNGNWVRWQRCYGELGEDDNLQSKYGVEGDGENNNSLANGMGPTGREVVAYPGAPVNFVEVFLDYEPLIDNDLTRQFYGDTQIYYIAAMMVRERGDQSISNQDGLSNSETWTCDRYDQFS